MNNIHPKIIRAWFDTVFNPLIDGLEIEIGCIKNNNITWRGLYNSFEMIKPLHLFINYRYHANLEQCTAYFNNVSISIDEHNSALSVFRESCNNLFHLLKDSKQFKDLYFQKVKEFLHNYPGIDDYKANDLKQENNLKFIAEYIINRKGNLDTGYILSPIWNLNMEYFFALLESEELNVSYQNFKEDKKKFAMIVDKISKELKTLRNNLSMQYGEPIVINSRMKRYE